MTPDLSPRQAAEQLGVSRTAVYRAIEAGELAAYKFRGRLRIPQAELDAVRERNRVRPKSRGPAYEPRRAPRRRAEPGSFAAELRAIRGGGA